MKKSYLPGLIMAIIGFVMLLVNAAGYLFDLSVKAPAFTVMGLVFVVVGMGWVRRSRNG